MKFSVKDFLSKCDQIRRKQSTSVNFESAKLGALRAKNVLTYQRGLGAYTVTCQCILRVFVLTCQHGLRDHVIAWQHALPPQEVVLMPPFSVSLQLLLELYTLLIRFRSLINVFPQ